MELFIRPELHISESGSRGRGVFTSTALAMDIVVECSPVIVMDDAARSHLDRTLLHDYIFEWQPADRQDCCVALGYLSLYNHTYAANCEYFMNYEERTMYIKTVRAIAAYEELTINYNGDWDNQSPLWFEAL